MTPATLLGTPLYPPINYLVSLTISHSFLKYPTESLETLGIRKGCFEAPSMSEEPNSNIDCPDIVAIEDPSNVTNYHAWEDNDQTLHPDCNSKQRYVMGTRLQTGGRNKKKPKHKLKTCEFHDLDLCLQGKKSKTMSQGKHCKFF